MVGCKQLFALLNQGVVVAEGFGVARIGIQIKDGLLNGKVDGAQLFALTVAVGVLVLVHHSVGLDHIR